MENKTNPPTQSMLLVAVLVGLGTLWGATIPLSKVATSTGHQPLGLIFWQLTFSALMLLLLTVVRGNRPHLKWRYCWHFLIISLLGTLIPNSFSFLSLAQLPAGIMAIIIASVPLFALLFALLFRLERFVLQRIFGVLLGATAVVALIGPEAGLPDPSKAIFVLIALVAPACYGLEACYLTRFAPVQMDPAISLLGASILGALIATPLVLATDAWINLLQPWGKPEYALFLSSMLHVAAYTGYIWLVSKAGAVFASQVAYIVTIAGVIISSLALSELYSGWVWVALLLMMIGIMLVQPRSREIK